MKSMKVVSVVVSFIFAEGGFTRVEQIKIRIDQCVSIIFHYSFAHVKIKLCLYWHGNTQICMQTHSFFYCL